MTNLVRDFMLALIFSLVLYLSDEFFFFVHFKIIPLMFGMTFVFGLLTSDIDEASGNLMGVIAGQALGCIICIAFNRPELPVALLDEVLRGLVDKCEFTLWVVGFPAGFIVRRFMPHSFTKTSHAVSAEEDFQSFAARNKFINSRLEARKRPLSMQLRDPGELATSPSIQILP